MDASKSDYWDRYYAGSSVPKRLVPSQFAVFVAGELAEPHRVVEFGCGNGRDSMLFATYGHDVTAIDGSAAATERAAELAGQLGEKVNFVAADVSSELAGSIAETGGPTVVYARFFVHAITEEEEAAFLDTAAALTKPGDLLAVEYRTVRDQSGAKETGAHYRRFVNPAAFDHAAAQRGFTVEYAAEGFGFAKYKQDDAYVARRILVRS